MSVRRKHLEDVVGVEDHLRKLVDDALAKGQAAPIDKGEPPERRFQTCGHTVFWHLERVCAGTRDFPLLSPVIIS